MAKGKVYIDQDCCKGCSLCISVCPKDVLELDLTVMNSKGYSPSTATRMEDCIGCGNCAIMCPDSCIKVVREV